MDPCPSGRVIPVRLDELGDHFRRYRLRVPQAVQAMAQSLRRWGQCAPIVATLRDERPQVFDGFTRWEAALQVRGMTTLLAHVWGGEPPRAKPRARKCLVFQSWVSGLPRRAEKV